MEANAKEAAMRQMGLKPAAKEERGHRNLRRQRSGCETDDSDRRRAADNPAGDADVHNMSKLSR